MSNNPSIAEGSLNPAQQVEALIDRMEVLGSLDPSGELTLALPPNECGVVETLTGQKSLDGSRITATMSDSEYSLVAHQDSWVLTNRVGSAWKLTLTSDGQRTTQGSVNGDAVESLNPEATQNALQEATARFAGKIGLAEAGLVPS